MAQDLSGLYISQSFQNLVQRSASGAFNVLATATGTEFIPVSASYAISSSNALTSSFANVNLQQVLENGNTADGIDFILTSSVAGGVFRMQNDGGINTMIDINNSAGENQLLYQAGITNNRFIIQPRGDQQAGLLFSTDNSTKKDTEIDTTSNLLLVPSSSFQGTEPHLGKVEIVGLLNAPYSAEVSQSLGVTGSLNVSNGITGSLDGNATTATSASHAAQADNAISSSYALTASFAENSVPAFPFTGSALITGSLAVTGSVSVGNQSGNNTISANSAFTAGSNQNNTGNNAVILGGTGHTNSGETSAIIGGESNSMNSDYSGIFGAASSTITNGDTSVIVGGYQNSVQGLRTFTLGGNLNTVNNSGAEFSGVIGGQQNTINGPYSGSVVIGGKNIQIEKHHNVAVPTLDVKNGNVEVLAGDVNVTGSIIGSGDLLAGQSAPAFSAAKIELGSTSVPVQYGNIVINGSNTRDLGNKFNAFQINTVGSTSVQLANSAFTGLGNDIHLLAWGGNSTGRGDTIKMWSSGSSALLNVETETRFASSVYNDIETITIASNTASIDLNTSNTFKFTAQSTTTHIVATNIQAGQVVNIQITQDAGGTGAITFDPAFKFPGGTTPALTTAANAIDLISAVSYDGTTLLANGTQNYS